MKGMSEEEYAGTRAAPEAPFVIRWGTPGVGFGEFRFWHDNMRVLMTSERMSKDFVKAVLCKMVDDAEIWDQNIG